MASTYYEPIRTGVTALRTCLEGVAQARKTFAQRPFPQGNLPVVTQHVLSSYRQLAGVLKLAGDIDHPNWQRDPDIGRELVPIAALCLKNRMVHQKRSGPGANPIDEPQKLFLQRYMQTHDNKFAVPAWFSQLYPFIDFTVKTEAFPGMETLRKNAGRPEDIMEYTQRIGLFVWPRKDILAAYSSFIACQDLLLVHALLKRPLSQVIEVPYLDPSGKLERETLELLSIASFSREEALAKLVDDYLAMRLVQLGIAQSFSLIPKTVVIEGRDNLLRDAVSPLSDFFFSDAGNRESCMEALTASRDPALQKAAFAMLTSRTASSDAMGSVSFSSVFENPSNIRTMLWAYKLCLFSPNESFAECERAFEVSPQLRAAALPMIRSVRDFLSENEFDSLAKYLVERIEALSTDDTPGALFNQLGMIILLSLIGQSPKLSHGLKNRITNLRKISDMIDNICQARRFQFVPAAARDEIRGLSAGISKSLGMTMEDYSGYNWIKEELRAFYQQHALILANPKLLEGRQATEVAENGVFICGEPGVGKTFLVQCFSTEFGIPNVSINFAELLKVGPEKSDQVWYAQRKALEAKKERERNMDPKLVYIKDKIREAVEHSKNGLVVLFIDEFERVSHARTRTVEKEVAQLTADMLEEIETVRKEHPNILVFAASNYPDMVDLAMIREGRFDVLIEIKPPTQEDIICLINDTLVAESGYADMPDELVHLSREQLLSLSTEAEGLLPLSIKKAIIAWARLSRKDQSALTFEGLLGSMKAKKRKRAYYIERAARERAASTTQKE